jgi:hypothetical protein
MSFPAVLLTVSIVAGVPSPLQGQQAAPDKPAFEVASVKQNKSGDPPNSNFTLGPGDRYIPNGGLFSASGFPLITYIEFAYNNDGKSDAISAAPVAGLGHDRAV